MKSIRVRCTSPRRKVNGEVTGEDLPVFCQWLPKGPSDSIYVDSGQSGVAMMCWSERGQVEGLGENEQRSEYYMKSGPFRCEIVIAAEEGLSILIESGDFANPQLASIKRRIAKAIGSGLGRLVDLLQTKYGQTWLPTPRHWDSRTNDVDAYLSRYDMHWLSSGSWLKHPGGDWMYRLHSDGGGVIGVFLTSDDWRGLGILAASRDELPPSMKLLQSSHRHYVNLEYRSAIIDAVTAIEMAIYERLRVDCGDQSGAIEGDANFDKMSLITKIRLFASLLGISDAVTVQDACDIVAMRNEVVHEGRTPDREWMRKLMAIKSVYRLISGQHDIRFPGGAIELV